jgi:hypothetical protein
VPKVYWQYSSAEVLVLEYAPGVKINDGASIDRMGLDRQRLARLAVESYLQQILTHGFFHVGAAASRLTWLTARCFFGGGALLVGGAAACALPPERCET